MSLSNFGGHSSPSLRFASLMLTGVAVTAPAEAVGAGGPLSPGLTNQETPGRVLNLITKQTQQTTLRDTDAPLLLASGSVWHLRGDLHQFLTLPIRIWP